MKLAPNPLHRNWCGAWVNAIGQQHHDAIAIDPDRRAGESVVAERSRREAGSGELPAEAAIFGVRARRFNHELARDELAADEALRIIY